MQGHRQISVLQGHQSESDRLVARRRGAESVDLPGLDIQYFETETSVAGGKEATARDLAQGNTSALLCFSDVIALGAYFALTEAGLQVPRDMSVMGFDNLDWARDADPPLTTIGLPAAEMGVEVGNQIVRRLEHQIPISSKLLEARIVERASVAEAFDA